MPRFSNPPVADDDAADEDAADDNDEDVAADVVTAREDEAGEVGKEE